MIRTSRLCTVALAPFAAAVLSLTLVPSATADTDPGAGGGECSVVMRDSVPAAGKLKFTWTMSCTRNWSRIDHGITVQRWKSDKWVTVGSANRGCLSTRAELRRCSGSITVTDPSGTQRWKSSDTAVRYAFAGSAGIRAFYTDGTTH